LLLLPVTNAHASAETADELFRQGRELMKQGAYGPACERFERSLAEDAAIGTLLNLSLCDEKRGRLVRAADELRTFVVACSPSDARRPKAERHLTELVGMIPQLTIRFDSAITATTQTTVVLDETVLSEGALGRPLLVDPGEHTIRVTQSTKTRKYRVVLHESERAVQAVAAPEPAVIAPAVAPPLPHSAGRGAAPYVIGGIGLASLVAGLVAGGLALEEKHKVESHCRQEGCDSEGLAANRDGRTYATVSTWTSIAGGVALGAGAYLFFSTDGTEPRSASRVSRLPLVGIAGSF
jgi:hypothetical protein